MKTGDTDIADPLLDAIGTSLVERLVTGDLIADLLIAERLEGDIRRHIEGMFLRCCQQTDTCRHLMGLATQQT